MKNRKLINRGMRFSAVTLAALITLQPAAVMASNTAESSTSSGTDSASSSSGADGSGSSSSSVGDSSSSSQSTSSSSGSKSSSSGSTSSSSGSTSSAENSTSGGNTSAENASSSGSSSSKSGAAADSSSESGSDADSSSSSDSEAKSDSSNDSSAEKASDDGTGTAASDSSTDTDEKTDGAGSTGQSSGNEEEQAPVMNMSQDDASEEAQKENEDKPEQTNSQLIAQQHIVNVVQAEKNYRFYLVDKDPAFAVEDTAVLQEMKDDAAQAGTLSENDVVYILGDLKNGWYYVESGTVRGFIRSEKLTDDEETQKIIRRYESHAERVSRLTGTEVSAESYYRCATATVPVKENAAAMYSLATVYDRVVAKNDAVTKDVTGGLTVHDAMSRDAEEVGVLEAGDLAYILSECGDWAYIESGNVRGFVMERYLKTGDEASAVIGEKGGEDSMSVAEETVSPEDNAAFYYTTSSVVEGTAENPIRKALLETAENCVGNPYVWGGTSLTNGCDCSGFVQTLYGLYGISLPRTADQQAAAGTQIPVSEAEPGDLIFFAKDGYVYHVAICSGENTTIEAYNSQVGIINNTLDTAHAVWAVRVLDS